MAVVVACPVASADTTNGLVESSRARWTAGGEAIVTEAVVRLTDGQRVTVTQLGGTVGGVGLALSHHPSPLVAGDDVVFASDGRAAGARRLHPVRADSGAARYGVQRTTRSGRPIRHPSGCVSFVYDERGTARIDGDREWMAFDDALAAWASATRAAGCATLAFHTEIAADAPDGRDGVNTIHFRDDRWCPPATAGEPELCYAPDAVAVTRVWFVDLPGDPRDGEILEVDLDFNAVDFALGVDPIEGHHTDLVGAATHEIGHALGLAHACGSELETWPTDLDGRPVPSCDDASPDVVAATMYFEVRPGDTSLRTLEDGDREGACAVAGGLACTVTLVGGCSAGGDRACVLVGLSVVLWPLSRRRRRVHGPKVGRSGAPTEVCSQATR